MTKQTINIVHLYPKHMNIYGDWGNVLTVLRRAQWHGYDAQVLDYNPGQSLPKNADIIIGGGGQDSGQSKIQDDLLKIGDDLHKLANSGVPMLMICGLYQLFGRFFETSDGQKIQGISIFKAQTYGTNQRLIGNIVTQTPYGQLVGYENHSGQTHLDDDQPYLGKVIKGAGNNASSQTEGAIYKNVFGSYLHGSLLPKNPQFADTLLRAAAERKYGNFKPQKIDDLVALKAHAIAATRPR